MNPNNTTKLIQLTGNNEEFQFQSTKTFHSRKIQLLMTQEEDF